MESSRNKAIITQILNWLFWILVSAMLMNSTSCSSKNDNKTNNLVFIVQQETTTNDFNTMIVTIGETKLTATLADNSSAKALHKALKKRTITVKMRDYGNMEKVGFLKKFFPKNDQQITTEVGDLVLFHGCMLVIYYAPNSWNFTRLGKIDNITREELVKLLGIGTVKVTLSLEE